MEQPRILVVDDETHMRFLMEEFLQGEGYRCLTAESGKRAIAIAQQEPLDLVMLDYKMPEATGLEILPRLLQVQPGLVAIMVTAHDTREIALEAIQNGAYDYFSKPFDLDEMRVVIRRALEKRRLQNQLEQLQKTVSEQEGFPEIIGNSPPMQQVFDMIRRVADRDVNVLVTGESGTGKELVARALHRNSGRRNGPFVALNCASIPSSLLESELFGHERGAFTGAVVQRKGKLELARGGTLFLDEIGDMDFALQAKILRAIQEREFERVGGSGHINTDFRLVSATNCDLARSVRSGDFREDLYFRLNVVEIHLPALRERPEDIPLLAHHFLKKYGEQFGKPNLSLTGAALRVLCRCPFPGNVRELENVMQGSIVLAQGNCIQPDDLPPSVFEDADEEPAGVRETRDPEPVGVATASLDRDVQGEPSNLRDRTRHLKETVEKDLILKTLEECRWKRGETAIRLGISRRSLLRKMNRYGID